jgi:hypothetical protein
MTLHKQKKEIEKEQPAALPQGNTNVFIGSTTELQKLLKKEKEVIQIQDSDD